ncbi:class I SAM-dependent methyltransferase [Desulfocurvus sp. DL9XJH121]
MCGIQLFDVLARLAEDLDQDPYPPLADCLERQLALLKSVDSGLNLFLPGGTERSALAPRESVRRLYEEAWTVYDRKTYDHSVGLIKGRLAANGFGREFFEGKICFDGGCGTGRFGIAMAELGAARVVAADIGRKSLDFAAERARERDLENVEFVQADITDLSAWADESFDMVVSNGVLHHTVEQDRGLREHYRITRPGGVFWLYLYGADSLFWRCYDLLRELFADIDPEEAKTILMEFQLRPGTVYTFLDNVYAPIRTYYRQSEVQALFEGLWPCETRLLDGPADFDSIPRQLASPHGRTIFGPEGEVRAAFTKKPR